MIKFRVDVLRTGSVPGTWDPAGWREGVALVSTREEAVAAAEEIETGPPAARARIREIEEA